MTWTDPARSCKAAPLTTTPPATKAAPLTATPPGPKTPPVTKAAES